MKIVCDQENSVSNSDPAKRNESNQTRNGQVLLGDNQGNDSADEGCWECVKYLKNNPHRREQQHQHNEHADDRYRCQHSDKLCRSLLAFELASILDEVADRYLNLAAYIRLDCGDCTGKIAPLRIAANYDPTTRVFAID